MLWVGSIKVVNSSHEEVASCLLIVLRHLLATDQHVLVFVVAHEQVLELLAVDVLGHRVVALDKEKTRVSYCLGWRQELALVLDILAIFDSW